MPEFCCHGLRFFYGCHTQIVTSHGKTVHIQICDFYASAAKCFRIICEFLRKIRKEAEK